MPFRKPNGPLTGPDGSPGCSDSSDGTWIVGGAASAGLNQPPDRTAATARAATPGRAWRRDRHRPGPDAAAHSARHWTAPDIAVRTARHRTHPDAAVRAARHRPDPDAAARA